MSHLLRFLILGLSLLLPAQGDALVSRRGVSYPVSISFSPSAPNIPDNVLSGTVVSTAVVQMSNNATFSGTLTLTNSDSGNFDISGANIRTANGSRSVGVHNVTVRATQGVTHVDQVLPINVTPASDCTITQVFFGPGTFTSGVNNAEVGQVAASTTGTCGPNVFSLTDMVNFHLDGITVRTSSALAPGDYPFDVVDTVTGATGSPKHLSVTAVGSGVGCTITGASFTGGNFAVGVPNAIVGTASATHSGSCPNPDVFTPTGADAAKFQFIGNQLQTVGAQGAGAYNIAGQDAVAGAISSPFPFAISPVGIAAPCSITSISLSGLDFVANVSNAIVGTASSVTSNCGANSFSIVSTGTDHSGTTCSATGNTNFLLSSAPVTTNGSKSAGSYPNVCIKNTIGATAFTQAFTLTGSVATFLTARTATNYDGSATPSTFYASIGQGFAQGAIPSGFKPQVRLNDGTTVVSDQQCQNTVAWGDGSLKFAQLTWKYPSQIAASGTDTIKVFSTSGSCPTTTSLTTAPLLAQDYKLQITIGATLYTLSLNNELNAGTRVKQIRAGPTMAGWKVWGAFRNGTTIGSADQGDLWGIFYVYVYSDGTIRVWPEAFSSRLANSVANGYNVATFAFKNGASTICSASTQFFSAGNVMACPVDGEGNAYYSGTDTKKVVWAFPTLTFGNSTTTNFYDARLVWWYQSTPTSRTNTSPSALGFTYTPNSTAYADSFGGSNWDSTGASAFIGPLSSDDVALFLTGTYDALVGSRVATLNGLGNTYWFWDLPTGYPANLTSNVYASLPAGNTNVGWGQGPTITINGGTHLSSNATHAPDFGYMQYLYSGDEWWLEMAQGVPVGNIGASDYHYRNTYTEGNYAAIYGTAGRGNAWYTRNIGNASWVTPDTHPMKPYLAQSLSNQLTALDSFYASQATGNPLGIVDFGDVYGQALWSGWMHDHLATSLSMEVRRGTESASATFITGHVIKAIYGRANNGCAYNAADYRFGVGGGINGDTPAFPQTWSQEWQGSGIPLTQPITTGCLGSGFFNGYGASAGDDYALLLQYGAETGSMAGISGASTVSSYAGAAEAACAPCTETWWGGQQWKRIRVPQ